MGYDELAKRLDRDGDEATVTALPDGSVDDYYTLSDLYGNRIEDRDTFAETVASTTSFPIDHESTEPGGQAVNMARQADALEDDVALFGHLDDPVFEELSVDAVSMGDPATMSVYTFADEDVLFSNDSEDIAGWSLDTYRAVADDPRDRLAADAICWGNWASVGGTTDALASLAAASIDGGAFVLDPGPITVRSGEAVARLFDALGALDTVYDVVVSVNRTELEYAAESLSIDADATLARLDRLRERSGITATVLHAAAEAAAASRADTASVSNLETEAPERYTGAGDRFSAGLAHALARDWDWPVALALGNCCASHYVETAETGDRSDLRQYLRKRKGVTGPTYRLGTENTFNGSQSSLSMAETNTRYDEGDEVVTPDGPGVVTAVVTDDFAFPQDGEDEYTDVSASDDQPAHVVGLEAVGSAVYRANALEATDLEDDSHPDVSGEALTDLVDEDVNGLDDLPDGWDRDSVLEYWSSIGGSWEECVDDLQEEFEEERANQQCSAMKDEVLRTERWRNRF